MRLIDADALLEKMKGTYRYFDVKFDIEEQPTAYDTEKVIAELEKESDFFSGKPMGTLQKAYYCKGIERAIEIVRNGGVE